MAISHDSIIHKPLDYTAPVNLDLLGRVLQYKQGQYDSGVAKVQQGIDNLASMDIVKGADKDYFNNKLNGLVQQTNSIGGADYSDPNVSNQIAGLASDVYSDQNVIGAIANTRKFRYVQNYYETLKEKHPKDWNPANEWFDMNKFSGWLSDGQVGTTPDNGAGQVNPYVDYQKDWQNMFNKMTANMTTTLTDKGENYVIDGKTYVDKKQIWDAASKLLSPNQRAQIGIEGRYTYQGVAPENILKAADAQQYQKLQDAKSKLEDYKTRLLGATDVKDQQDYKNLIASKQKDIDAIMNPVQKNLDQLKESLYLNEKLDGLSDRYAYERHNARIQPNTAAMFNRKMNLAEQKFQHDQINDNINQQIDIAKNGLMWSTDALGNKTLVPDPNHPKWASKSSLIFGATGSGANSIYGTDNASGEQRIETTGDSLNLRKGDLVNANTQLYNKFVQDFGWQKGMSDVEINSFISTGHLTPAANPQMQEVAKQMKASLDAMTQGNTLNYDKLDDNFKQFYQGYQENLQEINAIDKFSQMADNAVSKKYGIDNMTKNQVDVYNALMQRKHELNSKYPIASQMASPNTYAPSVRTNQAGYDKENAEIDNLVHVQGLDKLIQNPNVKAYYDNRDKEKEDYLTKGAVRYNFHTVIQNDDKNGTVAKMIATNAGQTQWYNENNEAQLKETLNPDNVEPMSKGYAMLHTANGLVKQPVMTFKYKLQTSNGEEKYQIRKVQLTPNQAQAFGFGTDVKDITGTDFSLHLIGQAPNRVTLSGSKYQLKYDIVKMNPSDNDDQRVFLRVYDQNGNKMLLFNKDKTSIPSYQQAVQFMEGSSNLKSYQDAINYLTGLSRGETTLTNQK